MTALPEFLYRPNEMGGEKDEDDIHVSVKREKDDQFGNPLGRVRRRERGEKGDKKYKEYWSWTETHPRELLGAVEYVQFPNMDMAVQFLYLFHEKLEEFRKSNPVSDDMNRYLTKRAEKLEEEQRRVLEEFWRIRDERVQLSEFAKLYNLPEVAWRTEDADMEQQVEKLLDLQVHVKRKEVPFVSEAALYELIGKEDARTVLSLLRRIFQSVAPIITGERM